MAHEAPPPNWYNPDKPVKIVVKDKTFTLPPLRPPVKKVK